MANITSSKPLLRSAEETAGTLVRKPRPKGLRPVRTGLLPPKDEETGAEIASMGPITPLGQPITAGRAGRGIDNIASALEGLAAIFLTPGGPKQAERVPENTGFETPPLFPSEDTSATSSSVKGSGRPATTSAPVRFARRIGTHRKPGSLALMLSQRGE